MRRQIECSYFNFKVIFASVFVSVLLVGVINCQAVSGNAIRYLDGDTIEFRELSGKTYKVRFAGIDAPEAKQNFGDVCTETLKSAIFGKTLTINPFVKGRYSRTIAQVLDEDKRDVGLYLVSVGCAWMYSTPSHLRKLYRYELVKAQKNKIGLWSEPNPEKPQDYRRREICRGEN